MSTLRTDTLQTTDSVATVQVKDLAVKSDLITPVNSIAALRLIDSSKVATVTLLGNTVKGLGGGTYYFDASDTTSTEDLTKGIIVGLAGARWKIVNTLGALSNTQTGQDVDDFNGHALGFQTTSTEVGNGNKYNFFSMRVNQDKVSQVAGVNGATGSKVNGLSVHHLFGGTGSRGGRHAIDGVLLQTAADGGPTEADNTDRNYVGVQGQVITYTGDGGTGLGDLRGAYFGASSYGSLLDNAYWTRNVTGHEFNTYIQESTGATRTSVHSGLQIASYIGQNGADVDAAISISNLGGPLGWRTGIHFHALNGRPALNNVSTIIKAGATASSSASIDRVIDIRGLGTAAILSADNTSFTDGGLDLFKANSFLNLGPTSVANSPSVTFRSAGLGASYDSRIISTQGSGTPGQGNLQVDANGLITPVVRPVTDNVYSVGLASFRYSVIYSNTGTINTSDAREKTPVQGLSSAEINAAKQLAKEIGTYKWLEAVSKKGDSARNHIGLTVQKAVEIMHNNGLDPMSYGFICHDTWEATEAVYAPDPDGNDRIVQPAQEAGDRYGFRWDELSAFLAAGFEARLAALEAL